MGERQNPPLDSIDPVLLIDAIVSKVRDGAVANRPVHVAVGISVDGIRDVLGLWMGPSGGEGAKQWMNMPTELRSRGILGAYIVCRDGLKGLPEAATAPGRSPSCEVKLAQRALPHRHHRRVLASPCLSELGEAGLGRVHRRVDHP